MKISKRSVVFALGVFLPAFLAAGVAWVSINQFKLYGLTLFVAAPALVGFLSCAIIRFAGPQNFLRCARIAVVSGLVLGLGFLAIGAEGVLCMIMAIPITLPLIFAGAGAAYLLFHRSAVKPTPTTAALLLLVAIAGVAEPRIDRVAPRFERSDSMIVNAPAARVWHAILTTERMPAPDDWLLRTGVACPQTARITRPGAGGERVCTLSTGEYVEAIEIWEPARRIRWSALSTPPPLKEVNPLHPEVSPPHLNGFYEADAGEIVIEPMGATRAKVTRRTWYRHNLYPAFYWKQWCDIGASRAHRFVLRAWKTAAEVPRGEGA